jgi:cytochrome c oxidase cbb3-type subunit I/II
MKRAKTIALVAGFGFFFLALIVQALLPYFMKQYKTVRYSVTRTIRTPLGQLTQVKTQAVPYADLLAKGRKVFMHEGCWYCHSQFTRPVAGEERRWGPVPEVGEYAYDLPHLLSTRRIGPDILRVGGKYGDDWHAAHYFDPRMVVPDSVMPKFTWFFKKEGDHFVLNDDGRAVVAYVQNLGMARGKWRDDFPYQIAAAGSAPAYTTPASIAHGKEVYERRCIGCHGEKGDGKGTAPSTVLFTVALPRDFTTGQFKFRTTPSGALPLDSDIYRTITVGIRGAAMPPWFNLAEEDRWDVIHYIKTFAPDFASIPPEQPIFIPPPPAPTAEMLAQGKSLFEKMKCWECHGHEGKGDGPKSDTLADDFGNKILPTDFTKGIFKSGPRQQDIFRTFMTGLNGTPMPSYFDAINQLKADPWPLAYFILSFSADKQ